MCIQTTTITNMTINSNTTNQFSWTWMLIPPNLSISEKPKVQSAKCKVQDNNITSQSRQIENYFMIVHISNSFIPPWGVVILHRHSLTPMCKTREGYSYYNSLLPRQPHCRREICTTVLYVAEVTGNTIAIMHYGQ